MRRRKTVVDGAVCCLAALLALAASEPGVAAPPVQFCGMPQKPLLTVDSNNVLEFGGRQTRSSTFIFADGTVVDSEILNVTDPTNTQKTLPKTSRVARGTAGQDAFAALVSALAAARAGFARDCYYTLYDSGDFTDSRLTWYGRGSRKNTFLVSTNSTTGPDCRQEINDLIDRIAAVRGSALASPATEILASGPFK